MERRRCPNRKAQMEMVLASIFLASRVSQNVCYLSEVERQFPPNAPQPEHSVNGTNVPVEIPANRTKQVISGHDVFFALLWAAVNRKQRGVLRFLERAELKEGDVWYSSDYRQAQQIVTLCDQGCADPYTVSFLRVHNIHPGKVISWWRDREKLYRLCELGGSNTPLLHVNLAEELDKQSALIPDYDYSQVSPVPPTPRHPAKKPAAPATTSSGDRGAGLRGAR